MRVTGRSCEGNAKAQKHRTASAISGGSMAAERLYRTSGTLIPVFPVLWGGLQDRGPLLALCPFFL